MPEAVVVTVGSGIIDHMIAAFNEPYQGKKSISLGDFNTRGILGPHDGSEFGHWVRFSLMNGPLTASDIGGGYRGIMPRGGFNITDLMPRLEALRKEKPKAKEVHIAFYPNAREVY